MKSHCPFEWGELCGLMYADNPWQTGFSVMFVELLQLPPVPHVAVEPLLHDRIGALVCSLAAVVLPFTPPRPTPSTHGHPVASTLPSCRPLPLQTLSGMPRTTQDVFSRCPSTSQLLRSYPDTVFSKRRAAPPRIGPVGR